VVLAAGVEFQAYVLVHQLGAGGNGEVWLARHHETGDEVAIKLLLPHIRNDQERVERFENEMLKASGVVHPHIVPVITFGQWNERRYIVSRYIRGGTLRQRLESGELLPFTDTLRYLTQMADALGHIDRELGSIHRDVKPENILLSTDRETCYLTDFGLALNPHVDPRLTRPGSKPPGSGRYMAPEQWTGGELSHQTDIYALGIMAYELLTGQRPFHEHENGPDYLIAIAHIEAPIPRHPRLTEGQWQVICQAAAKKPDERFDTAQAFSQALCRVSEFT
jgi:serine/threonine protein kinase